MFCKVPPPQSQRKRVWITVENIIVQSKIYKTSYINNEAYGMGFFFPVIV